MTKIRAHKCEVKQVEKSAEYDFLEKYHYQGYVTSSICYGLFYNDDLVELMSFGKPRYNKKYKSELLRLCTKKDYIVYGGASKLFNEALSKEDLGSIVSYCNEDLFSGKVYEVLGFTKTTLTKGYHYEKDGKSYSRQSFQKWRCLEKWPEFKDKNITEREIMAQKGYVRVDDTKGQSTWTYGIEFKWYIYRIDVGPYVYIGQHKYTDINEPYYGSGTILKRAQEKYGLGKKTVLYSEINSQEEANNLEIYEISAARTKYGKNCINIMDGGTGYVKSKTKHKSQGHPWTEEHKKIHSDLMKKLWEDGKFTGTKGMHLPCSDDKRKQLSESNKGKKRTPEQCKKIGEAHKGQVSPMKGKHLTEETKKKLSEANKGRHHTEEAKAKISAALKGKTHSGNHSPKSEEMKRKVSESLKGRKRGHWYNNGQINVLTDKCPKGFTEGRLKSCN